MLASLFALALSLGATPDLSTVSERSGFLRTGRYEETIALCAKFAEAFPQQVRCDRFGVTPEGRPMLALVASSDGMLTAERARRLGRPVVVIQGGIHAGEIDGKDAGFLVLRDLLQRKGFASDAKESPLSRFTLVFIPVFNVDGHERFGPNQRPNQRGPEETGWRVTARNLNLNRDYAKADSEEVRHLLRLLGQWDPVLYVDLHATDGAQFRHDVAVMIEPLTVGPPELTSRGRALSDNVLQRLTEQGHLPLPFYPSFRKDDDPQSGFAVGVAPPRFSHASRAIRNRFGVLVETHSWRTYPERVKVTARVLEALFLETAQHGEDWLKAAAAADARDARAKIGEETILAWEPAGATRTIDFLGYAYEHVDSPVSGAKIIRYDEKTPQVWRVPLVEGVRPTLTVRAPEAYVIPAAWAPVVEPLLRLHGLRYDVLGSEKRDLEVEQFRATEKKFRATSYEGRQPLEVKGQWQRARVSVREGSLVVPVAQPGRRLVLHLFEPGAPDALITWGLFNAAFEQKEYVEDYVVEPFARELLASDPKVRALFEARLKDEAFAKDPSARLRFFAERHPAWDSRLDLYPVMRVRLGALGEH